MPNIAAHFLPGKGNVLVVTFNEMWNHYKDQRFWAENPLRKLGLPSYGVTSDGPHWYPPLETIKALREPVKAARSYEHVVLYGYSMGAYAALKYSWLFENPIVLAFSPQYSIDPNDIGALDERYTPFYNPSQKVSRIENQDLNGTNYIFYDPTYALDAHHVRLIGGSPKLVPMRRCGHETIHSIRSSKMLGALVAAATTRDHRLILEISRNGRRINPFYYKYSLIHLSNRGKLKAACVLADKMVKLDLNEPDNLAIAADVYKRCNRLTDAYHSYMRAFDLSGQEKFQIWAREVASQGLLQTRG